MSGIKYGGYFQKLTGKEVTDFSSMEEINAEVQAAKHKRVEMDEYKSSVVPSRGNVFEYTSYDNLNEEIDACLSA